MVKPRVSSSPNTALFDAISLAAKKRSPGVLIATPLSVGGTDMPWYREAGIITYGIDPFLIDRSEHFRGHHGNDERLSVDNLRNGISFIYDILRNLN